MGKTYPFIAGTSRRPDNRKDGKSNYGKPCVICGQNTVGRKWLRLSCMRGEDEEVRLCFNHWETNDTIAIECYFKTQSET